MDGCNGSHDHVIAAAEKVARFCLLQVYKELKKLPVFCLLPFVLNFEARFLVFVRMDPWIMEWSEEDFSDEGWHALEI
jgi:hypothetical protein